jgi:signal transduction histidine kinase
MSSAPELDREGVELQRLVGADTIEQLVESIHELFGVSLLLFAEGGVLLAQRGSQASLCALVNEGQDGRRACTKLVNEVKRSAARASQRTTIECFTEARYDVLPIEHEGDAVGRLVVGPYRIDRGTPPSELPASLPQVDERLDHKRALELLPAMPTLSEERAAALERHLRMVLHSLVVSGYAKLVTSKLHVAATQESYRELQRKDEQLEEANDRLEEIDGLKASFLSTVSHELRTPLTSIMGYSDMLIHGLAGDLSDDQQEYITIIQRQSEHLLSLIQTMLDEARAEAGKLPVERQALDVFDVVAEVVTTLTPQAVDSGVYIDVKREEVPAVRGDAGRLRQVFTNLIHNALKFSDPGALVTVTAARGDPAALPNDDDDVGFILFAPTAEYLELRVIDQGPGIPEHEKKRVFEAFYQVDQTSTREHPGTGLGLSIVKRLVEAHGGTIHVEDAEPKGAVFVVNLPISDG